MCQILIVTALHVDAEDQTIDWSEIRKAMSWRATQNRSHRGSAGNRASLAWSIGRNFRQPKIWIRLLNMR